MDGQHQTPREIDSIAQELATLGGFQDADDAAAHGFEFRTLTPEDLSNERIDTMCGHVGNPAFGSPAPVAFLQDLNVERVHALCKLEDGEVDWSILSMAVPVAPPDGGQTFARVVGAAGGSLRTCHPWYEHEGEYWTLYESE